MFNDPMTDYDAFLAFIEAHFTPNERWYFIRLIHLHDAENVVYNPV